MPRVPEIACALVLAAICPGAFGALKHFKPGWNLFSVQQDIQLGREATFDNGSILVQTGLGLGLSSALMTFSRAAADLDGVQLMAAAGYYAADTGRFNAIQSRVSRMPTPARNTPR